MEHPHQEPPPDALRNYELWSLLTRIGVWEMTQMRNEAPYLDYRPKISILLPVHNPKRAWLEMALDSVMSQAYPDWELCVCDDGSAEVHAREVLERYERLDERIKAKYLGENAGVIRATNEALSLASGEFVGLLGHDDALAPNALFEVVRLLQEHPGTDLVYTDEVEIDEEEKPLRPRFKPGWSPDLALGVNYLARSIVYRRSMLEEIGGWRESFDGAQDLDLMLRYTEGTERIHRIPKVLYHRRVIEDSVPVDPDFKNHAHEQARRAIEDALERRGVSGRVLDSRIPNCFRVEREIESRPKVSVLIPFRKGADYVRCITSLERHTTYPNYEVCLIVAGTDGSEVGSLPEQARVVRVAEDSTPLELYNAATRQAEGEYVLLLDPDLEALSEGWLEALLQHARRAEVGAVGGKLVSEEGHTLQAGLILNPEEREDLPQIFHRPLNREHPGLGMFVDLVRNCSAVSGTCMMFRKEIFEAAGGFDSKHLEHSFGDVDLCLRLRERGCLVVYTPHAEFTRHDFEHATGLEPEQARYVRERWGEMLENDPYYNPNLSWSANDLLRSMLNLIGFGNRVAVATRKSRAMEH